MSNSSRFVSPAAIVIVTIAAILALAGSLLPTREETRTDQSIDYRAADYPTGTAVVTSMRAREGFTLFWIDFRKPEQHVDVMFELPGECWERIQNEPNWPIPDPGCAGPAGLAGTISGSGRTAEGNSLAAVSIEVSPECFTAVTPGMAWPPPVAACTDPTP